MVPQARGGRSKWTSNWNLDRSGSSETAQTRSFAFKMSGAQLLVWNAVVVEFKVFTDVVVLNSSENSAWRGFQLGVTAQRWLQPEQVRKRDRRTAEWTKTKCEPWWRDRPVDSNSTLWPEVAGRNCTLELHLCWWSLTSSCTVARSCYSTKRCQGASLPGSVYESCFPMDLTSWFYSLDSRG